MYKLSEWWSGERGAQLGLFYFWGPQLGPKAEKKYRKRIKKNSGNSIQSVPNLRSFAFYKGVGGKVQGPNFVDLGPMKIPLWGPKLAFN